MLGKRTWVLWMVFSLWLPPAAASAAGGRSPGDDAPENLPKLCNALGLVMTGRKEAIWREPVPGPLRTKAAEADAWMNRWHRPDWGGTSIPIFADYDLTEIETYDGKYDSASVTGGDLRSQAFRWAVTRECDAMSNVLRLALYVQKLREVTETPGYLARYAADQSSLMYPGDQDCNESAVKTCVHTETGPWAGTWHLADASQDVYYNLASGLYWAWELVPNPAVRAAVEEVVLDVFRTFRSNGWKIMNRHGQVETSGRLSITHKLVWTLIAVHVTGDADARQFLESLMSHDIDHRRAINLADTNTLNKFYDYFANYNRITAYGVILHAASRHVDSSDYRWLVEHFDEDVHKLGLTRMAHRPYFTASGIAFGEIAGQEEHAQLVGDLALVPGPPDTAVQRPAIDLPASDLDPLSRLLHGLGTNYHLVARDAFPIDEQCWHSWLSSWTSPFLVEACGFDHPRRVAPPSFYLNAYWLSRWAGMIDGAD